MILSDEDKILIKFVFEGVHSEEVDNEFSKKSQTKNDVNKLFKKLRDTGTVSRRPGSGRPQCPH